MLGAVVQVLLFKVAEPMDPISTISAKHVLGIAPDQCLVKLRCSKLRIAVHNEEQAVACSLESTGTP